MHRIIATLLVFGTVTLFPLAGVQASPYQFAQFNIVNANEPFTFTNNGGTSATIGALNVPVTFNFTAATGLSTANRAAFLSVSPVGGSSTVQPAVTAGSLVDQPISLTDRLTLTSGMNGTGTNFLTMTFTGDITGLLGGPGASLLGADNNPSAPRIVTYTSDFGTFVPPTPGNSYNLSLQDITPALAIGPGGFLSSFASNVNGQFSGNFVPEPASVVLAGIAMIAAGGLAARRKRLAKGRI